MGANSVIGPNFLSVDVSLTRNFNITESHQVQIRAEAFNLQNRANFNTPTRVAYPAGPDAPMNSATFGRITQANPARIMQFAIKYQF
jgi:hypothetical protein